LLYKGKMKEQSLSSADWNKAFFVGVLEAYATGLITIKDWNKIEALYDKLWFVAKTKAKIEDLISTNSVALIYDKAFDGLGFYLYKMVMKKQGIYPWYIDDVIAMRQPPDFTVRKTMFLHATAFTGYTPIDILLND
jgi:hypothetical protein